MRQVVDLRRRVGRLEAAAGSSVVGFTRPDALGGAPVNTTGFVTMLSGLVTRGLGSVLVVEGQASPPAGVGMECRLACSALGIEGPLVAVPAGGAWVRMKLELPDVWAPGEARAVQVRGRITSGSGTGYLEVAVAWQR